MDVWLLRLRQKSRVLQQTGKNRNKLEKEHEPCSNRLKPKIEANNTRLYILEINSTPRFGNVFIEELFVLFPG